MDLPTFKAARGLSLVALATLLKLPAPTVHKYLSGARKVEDPERMEAIVAATDGEVTAMDLRPDWAGAVARCARMPAGGKPGRTKEAR